MVSHYWATGLNIWQRSLDQRNATLLNPILLIKSQPTIGLKVTNKSHVNPADNEPGGENLKWAFSLQIVG